MTTRFLLLLMVGTLVASAQTNAPVAFTTNWVRSAESFRVLEGQLYNVEKSFKFSTERGQVVAVQKNGVVFARKVERKVFYPAASVGGAVRSGNFLGVNPSTSPRGYSKSEWELNGELLFVKNFPQDSRTTTGSEHTFNASKTGTYTWQGDVIEEFDYGLPTWVGIVATNGRRAFTFTTNSAAKAP